MATVNGTTDHTDDSSTTSSHLGKRKRSTSPSIATDIDGLSKSSLQQTLQKALQAIRKTDSTPSLLRYPLPVNPPQERSPKRTRLSLSTQENESIESRIQSGAYKSYDGLLEDVSRAKEAILTDLENGQINGKTRSGSISDASVKEQLSKIVDVLASYMSEPKRSIKTEQADVTVLSSVEPDHQTSQVLYLRTHTERGPQQLFSGLPIPMEGEDMNTAVDGRKLPNGFDLTELATMDPKLLVPTKDKRLFGDVFRPHRNLKQLEVPRGQRNAFRGNTLDFVSELAVEKMSPINKLDYKFQNLQTGAWLHYSEGSPMHNQEWRRRQRERTLSGGGEFKAALKASDIPGNEFDNTKSLFNAAFSSFAPTSDNSTAVISEQDRNRQWWHKNGQRKLLSIFTPEYAVDGLEGINGTQGLVEDNFEEVATNFEPFEQEGIPELHDDPNDVNDVLEEVSTLLETLHSYQRMRTLDVRASVTTTKPSSAEFDTYEMLRSQLIILVGSLPPFVVAKLDGDKLNDLNVSTNVFVDSVEYNGTSQADDFTLRRYRAVQVATASASRAVQPPPTRGPYQTPAALPRYGSNVSAYTQNSAVPATTAYGQRTATTYQTPRPPVTAQRSYPQSSYQQTGNSYGSQSTVQQFQRPVPNGYNSTPSQPSYMQRPTQPGYQQKAQDSALAYGRSVSPNKPVVNGLSPGPHSQPQYQRLQQPPSPAQQHATAEQRAIMERVKAYRQESGTPAPQTPGLVDGAADRNGTPTVEASAVEVSR